MPPLQLYKRPDPTLRQRAVAWWHVNILIPISRWYSRWTGERNPVEEGIYWLPFNLVVKYGPHVRADEALAMSFAHSIGLPAPRAISYGEHFPLIPDEVKSETIWGSVLMTRLPGEQLSKVLRSLSSSEVENIRKELDSHLSIMRKQISPWGSRVCSMSGGAVFGPRIPLGAIFPCDNETGFTNAFLFFCEHYRQTRPHRADDVIRQATAMLAIPHTIVFTHADLLAHNILVRDGHITGIIDWEFAGWFPEYWEYTQMLRVSSMEFAWPRLVGSLPGYRYQRELKAGQALWELAADSFSF